MFVAKQNILLFCKIKTNKHSINHIKNIILQEISHHDIILKKSNCNVLSVNASISIKQNINLNSG